MMLAICNARCTAAVTALHHMRSMDDGLLDVVLLKPVPRVRLAVFCCGYRHGEHLTPDGQVTKPFAPYMTLLPHKLH